MLYFEEMIEKELENPNESEFSELESTDEIADKIRENTLNQLEEETDFMREYPNPIYAVMRLDYLSYSEEQKHFDLLVDLYEEKTLIKHLMDIQKEAIKFMRLEKPRWMKAWNIESEDDPMYWTMISALREVTIKDVVEQI